ncbi:hypothetical protein [Piscirickettsia salmonis]|uniref:hypothetical protein n=1 Tax=Piscirickettsia salmonis TaxID=1238 RepID=UPI0006BD8E0E|nr:hypothetical protein [Piscirickettsia salmonis]ALA26679.1 hypothetical protein KW89_3p53 [Piscirickettsia salmonis]QGO82295.1 hypothetical protein Psal107_03346 [Piscirickettsia salmonis]QGP24124.1 hypothetical protein Psal158_03298 [Piscirickettsia salmonis]QGP27550.1 hypothetical protein Psal159_03343 [Piscirickettsia salmonis]QGP30896.1 hypothetical protein Psal160_03306 [Piscirickettsia salmonis]
MAATKRASAAKKKPVKKATAKKAVAAKKTTAAKKKAPTLKAVKEKQTRVSHFGFSSSITVGCSMNLLRKRQRLC